ncbi:MAG: DUF5615 family PIN-like protein [Bryobacteraceae bacterium]
MARFYSNENIPLPVAVELGRLGHDVLTSLDAGKANAAVPDTEVLAFAVAEGRILLSHNRRHFLHLHRQPVHGSLRDGPLHLRPGLLGTGAPNRRRGGERT